MMLCSSMNPPADQSGSAVPNMNKWCLQQHRCYLSNSFLRIFVGNINWKTFQWRTILNSTQMPSVCLRPLWKRVTIKSNSGTPGTQPDISSIANLGRLYVLWFASGEGFTGTKIISRSSSTSEWKYRPIFPPDRGKRAFIYTCPMSWTMKSTTSLESLLNMPCHSLSTTRCVK